MPTLPAGGQAEEGAAGAVAAYVSNHGRMTCEASTRFWVRGLRHGLHHDWRYFRGGAQATRGAR